MGPGIGRRARRNVWRVSRYGSAGVATAMTAATSGSAAAATRAPAAPIEWPRIATRETSGRAAIAATAALVSAANSPTDMGSVSGAVRAVAAHVERQDVEPGRVEDLGVGERPVTRGLPAVDERRRRGRGRTARA